mmetsp:Transcript_44702/g.65591  ORF Transcript_44702/g.65591 Transcript_44702/m.65591 type:complete len:207 (-) Transcript_44702:201-821(-)
MASRPLFRTKERECSATDINGSNSLPRNSIADNRYACAGGGFGVADTDPDVGATVTLFVGAEAPSAEGTTSDEDEVAASSTISSGPDASFSTIATILLAMSTQPVMHELRSGGLWRMSSSSCPPSCEGVSPTSSGTMFSEAREPKKLEMGLWLSTKALPSAERHKAPMTVGTKTTVPLEMGMLSEIAFSTDMATPSLMTCCKQLGS